MTGVITLSEESYSSTEKFSLYLRVPLEVIYAMPPAQMAATLAGIQQIIAAVKQVKS